MTVIAAAFAVGTWVPFPSLPTGRSAGDDNLFITERKMREAVVVSYARTGLAKAARGGFNNTSNADGQKDHKRHSLKP